jgi:hypothetical protein
MMAYIITVWNWSIKRFIHQSMSEDLFTFKFNAAIPIGRFRAQPLYTFLHLGVI